ncbi:hypothetical protein NQ176_g9136 [Zarea fungicola]|uniref:Uncharacterized protein n=1 Tax=Zarea fungicola TaxID=93591 RepID=A0ACC1MNY8_9HYPO|nr:hypothetical protein NQ176_g9136 [Lecanicillium fungicola]
MRVSTASLVTCLAGYALAQSLDQAGNSTVSNEVAASTVNSATASGSIAPVNPDTTAQSTGVQIVPNDEKNVPQLSRFANLTSANGPSVVVPNNILGSPPQIVNFINNLDIPLLQRLLGNDFGKPFAIPFYDSTTRSLVGALVGYFTTDGGVVFDTSRPAPYGAIPPTIQKQPGLIQAITVTATGPIAQGIMARGSVSDSDLRSLLGNDYGRPFRIIFPGAGGVPAGIVSGTFTADGVRFDPNGSIPKASVTTVTANGGRSGIIIQAGKASTADLQALLGASYGFGSFKIILTDNSGKQIGQVSGSFDDNGNPVFDSNTNIPQPSVFTVTASGGRSSSIIQAGRVTVGTLQALLGANYGAGPFRIILTDNSGKQIGLVSGSFDSNGNPTFDSNTNIPSPGPTTVTANGGRSASIIQAGRITIGDLQALLGDNYGSGSFVITLTDNSGSKIGQVSGSFDSNGNPTLDSNTNIPKPNPTTVTASGSVSRGIIQAGKVSNQVLQNLLGNGYGFGSFVVNLTDDSGNQIGQVSGSFDSNGNPTFDSNTNIPKPKPTTVTASGSVSSGIIQAGKVSNQVLQSLLGNGYGFGSFLINLTDNAGKQIGTVSGSFDDNGNPVFDSNTNIPAGLTTVTADSSRSNSIIQAGKASVSDLKAILGQNYGKGTFKILLTDSNGKQIGTVSGSYDSNGNPVFDPNTNIPAGLTTVTANAGRSSNIIQAGKASVSDLQALLGQNYGKGTFNIILTDSTGKQIGSISGSFDSDGNPVFNPNSNIPSNVITVTASGGRSSSIIQNGKATIGDLQALLGDNYGFGKFKILLTDNNGKQIGVISGSFDSNGSPVFDSSTIIPAKPLIVTANPSVSNKIIQAGKATTADLQSR